MTYSSAQQITPLDQVGGAASHRFCQIDFEDYDLGSSHPVLRNRLSCMKDDRADESFDRPPRTREIADVLTDLDTERAFEECFSSSTRAHTSPVKMHPVLQSISDSEQAWGKLHTRTRIVIPSRSGTFPTTCCKD